MSFSSDLDLVTIYGAPKGAVSDGAKPIDAALYYTRLTQRLIAAISAPMAEGRLYHVDLRLRPSGEAGPVAVALDSFARYQAESAWTWEHMALTRVRVIAGPPTLARQIEDIVRTTLTAGREPTGLLADVADMRHRIAAEHPGRNRWDFKYLPGGLIDVEFAVQYLLLKHGHDHPDLLTTESAVAIDRLARAGIMPQAAAADLARALALAWRVQGLIRLTALDLLDPEAAPRSIKEALAREVARAAGISQDGSVDFARAETILDDILAASRERFLEIIERPAALLPPSEKRSR